MFVLVREGSAARNLKDLFSVITDHTAHRICIATDDRHPDDLLEKGHLDYTLRLLIEYGVSPVRAIRLMTLNPASLYKMKERGGIAPGHKADLVILDDLRKPRVRAVYHDGALVSEGESLVSPIPRKKMEAESSVRLSENLNDSLNRFPTSGPVRVIGILEGQLLTESLTGNAEEVKNGDLAYLAVVERYGKGGQVGLGFVKGLGMKEGAIASTVAHDSHNLIVAGKSVEEMLAISREVSRMGGGFAVMKKGKIEASVPLPIGGLMSLDRKSVV